MIPLWLQKTSLLVSIIADIVSIFGIITIGITIFSKYHNRFSSKTVGFRIEKRKNDKFLFLISNFTDKEFSITGIYLLVDNEYIAAEEPIYNGYFHDWVKLEPLHLCPHSSIKKECGFILRTPLNCEKLKFRVETTQKTLFYTIKAKKTERTSPDRNKQNN